MKLLVKSVPASSAWVIFSSLRAARIFAPSARARSSTSPAPLSSPRAIGSSAPRQAVFAVRAPARAGDGPDPFPFGPAPRPQPVVLPPHADTLPLFVRFREGWLNTFYQSFS